LTGNTTATETTSGIRSEEISAGDGIDMMEMTDTDMSGSISKSISEHKPILDFSNESHDVPEESFVSQESSLVSQDDSVQ